MAALDTSTNRMLRARAQMTRKEFLDVYGFLRPGTYDIASPRYDEAPDDYFDWRRNSAPPPNPAPFVPSSRQARQIEYLLARHGLALDVDGLFEFIKSSTERREDAKFAFSRHLSQALRLISMVGRGHGLSVDDMSYTDISVFDRLYLGSDRPEHALGRSSDEGREGHGLTRRLVLPPMISAPEQVEAFHLPDSEPNYITQGAASGAVRRDATSAEDLRGKILLLESGDPGYDWIFSTGLAGFVTQYGGANSHMAIRAHQFAVPAVIGAGETLYNRLSRSHWIEIDCMNRRVEVIA
jgi:phosphohistidine swiveling domain-containing protein